MRYSPFCWLTVERVSPVAMFLAVIVTPGRIAPVSSFKDPLICAFWAKAFAAEASDTTRATASVRTHVRILTPPLVVRGRISHSQERGNDGDRLEKRRNPQVLVLFVLVVVEVHGRHDHGGKAERADERRDRDGAPERTQLHRRLAERPRQRADERAGLRIGGGRTERLGRRTIELKSRDPGEPGARGIVRFRVDETESLLLDVGAKLRDQIGRRRFPDQPEVDRGTRPIRNDRPRGGPAEADL